MQNTRDVGSSLEMYFCCLYLGNSSLQYRIIVD